MDKHCLFNFKSATPISSSTQSFKSDKSFKKEDNDIEDIYVPRLQPMECRQSDRFKLKVETPEPPFVMDEKEFQRVKYERHK